MCPAGQTQHAATNVTQRDTKGGCGLLPVALSTPEPPQAGVRAIGGGGGRGGAGGAAMHTLADYAVVLGEEGEMSVLHFPAFLVHFYISCSTVLSSFPYSIFSFLI